jgi:hypothetical protein
MVRLERRLPPAGAVEAVARAASNGSRLRAGREAIGQSLLGRGLLATKKPLGITSTALTGTMLAGDTNDYVHGRGSLLTVGLDGLGLLPSAGLAIQGISRARAITHAATGASRVTGLLDKVEHSTTNAAVVTKRLGGEADAVANIVEDAVTSTKAARSLAVKGATRPSEVQRLLPRASDTPLVTALQDQLAHIERQASIARAAEVPVSRHAAAVVNDELDRTVRMTRAARRELQVVEGKAARMAKTAHVAEKASDVATTTSKGTDIANSGISLENSLTTRRHRGAKINSYQLIKDVLSLGLAHNSRAV